MTAISMAPSMTSSSQSRVRSPSRTTISWPAAGAEMGCGVMTSADGGSSEGV